VSIASLLNAPRSKDEWSTWSFAHRDHHDIIRQAIQTQSKGANRLLQYQLDPIPSDEITDWLSRNQQSHDDMNQVLNLQGVDLQGVDFNNKQQLAVWILQHWQEHQSAAARLAI